MRGDREPLALLLTRRRARIRPFRSVVSLVSHYRDGDNAGIQGTMMLRKDLQITYKTNHAALQKALTKLSNCSKAMHDQTDSLAWH